ncbi:MAG: hypothetical protein ACJAUP_002719 [Cellvibrionaceae bacterium]|jgi:hypothetical protein
MLLQDSKRLKKLGRKLSFCEMKNIVNDGLDKKGYLDKLDAGKFYFMPDDALFLRAHNFDEIKCDTYTAPVFKQRP